MREKYIEQQLAKEVRSRGGLCEKWNSGTSGWPDRIVILPDGKVGFVEVKAPGKEPRKLQTHRLRLMLTRQKLSVLHASLARLLKLPQRKLLRQKRILLLQSN